jgi:nucleotide-binding universal stress UspA family protein
MYAKILLAYDGSHDGRKALDQAADLARLAGAEVVLLAVIDVGIDVAVAEGVSIGSAVESQLAQMQQMLAEGAARLAALGIRATTRVETGQAGERIVATAREIAADLIVLGHRQHSLWSRWMKEPVGPFLLQDPPCNLLICVER